MTKKVGRNDPCPCGSGKKFKKCCQRLSDRHQITPDVVRRLQQAVQRHDAAERTREAEFGKVRPIIHANLAGKKMVAVGNRVYWSPEEKWKTFPDFLLYYIKTVLGSEWGEAELAKPSEAQHQIIQWYRAFLEFSARQPQDKAGIIHGVPNGPSMAYFCLAYDLYALRHHGSLQDEVVRRLRIADQFQGARYELYVAATCIRAGFDIAYEDETDTSRRHPEFVATHCATGEQIAVEAKSKRRPGVLGFGDNKALSDDRPRVQNLLRDAFSKGVTGPYAIFLDLNLPPAGGPLVRKPWLKGILDTLGSVGGKGEDGRDEFNLLLLTNHPHHYGSPTEPDPPRDLATVFSRKPRFPVSDPTVLLDLHKAAEQYGHIPNEFSDSSVDPPP